MGLTELADTESCAVVRSSSYVSNCILFSTSSLLSFALHRYQHVLRSSLRSSCLAHAFSPLPCLAQQHSINSSALSSVRRVDYLCHFQQIFNIHTFRNALQYIVPVLTTQRRALFSIPSRWTLFHHFVVVDTVQSEVLVLTFFLRRLLHAFARPSCELPQDQLLPMMGAKMAGEK